MSEKQQLSFIRLSSGSFPTSGLTVGAIYFCPEDHTIGVATSTTTVEKYYGGNVKNAVYTKNADGKTGKLTISYNNGDADAVLDFSDMASADAVKKELDSLKALHAVASTDGSGKKTYKTVATEINDALGGLNLTEVKGGYISAVKQENGHVTATASSFDTSIPASNPSESNAPTTAAVKTYVDGKINDLDVPEVNGGSKGYIVSVKQQDGKVEATAREFITDLSANLGTLVEGNAPTSKAVKDYVAAEIGTAKSSLDFSDTASGDFVKSISRANGVVTISKSNFETTITADSKSKVAPTSEAVAGFVKTQLSSLGNALHFRGAGTKAEMDALTNKADGDIYIINSGAEQGKEYVYSGGVWVELGDEGKAASLINALDVTDTEVTGQYVSKVDQVDGKIKVTRKALPTPTYNSTIAAADDATDSNAPTSGAVKTYVSAEIGKLDVLEVNGGSDGYIVSVKQQDGKVEATARKFITDLSANLGDLVKGNAPTSKAVKDYVGAEIGKLDYTDNVIGSFVTTVNQTDGTVSITKGAFDSAIPASSPSTSTAPTTAAVKSYVDDEVSKAVGGALVWSSWE